MKNLVLFSAAVVTLAGSAAAQSRGLVDELKSRGMNAGFSSREELYREHFGDSYRGTAAQNQRLLQAIGGDGATELNRSTAKPKWLTNTEWEAFRREECRPKLDPEKSADSFLLDRVGYDDSSCCGSSRRCERMPKLCLENDLGMQIPQQRACYRHDLELDRLQRAFDDPHPDVQSAHRRLEDESTDPLVAAPFAAMRKSREAKQRAEDFSRNVRRSIDEFFDF